MANEKSHGIWKVIVFGLSLVALLVGARMLDLDDRISELREWLDGLGAAGYAAFLAIYIVAVVAMVPGSALSIAAGALFGLARGVVLVSIGATVGAALAFLVSRHVARGPVERWLAQNDRFRRLDRLTETQGPIIVGITRLVPLFPFNLLNYGFGLTRVPFWTYVFWSWLCMLPGAFLYVGGADAMTTAMEEGRVPWTLVGVVLASALLVAVLVRKARSRLRSDRLGTR